MCLGRTEILRGDFEAEGMCVTITAGFSAQDQHMFILKQLNSLIAIASQNNMTAAAYQQQAYLNLCYTFTVTFRQENYLV